MVEPYWLDQFPRLNLAGSEFYRVPNKFLREHYRKLGLPVDKLGDGEDQEVLWPYRPSDLKSAFPGEPSFERRWRFCEIRNIAALY